MTGSSPGTMLARALELLEECMVFYDKAIFDCPSAKGQAVFQIILRDKRQQIERIRTMAEKLKRAGGWEEASVLDAEKSSLGISFAELAEETEALTQTCMSEVDAVDIALATERRIADVFQAQIDCGGNATQIAFYNLLLEETDGFITVLESTRAALSSSPID